MNSTATKERTLTYTLGEPEQAENWMEYYDFLDQFVSLFTIDVQELINQDGVWHCSWARDNTSSPISFKEKKYHQLFTGVATLDQTQESNNRKRVKQQNPSYSDILNACFNLADDFIITEIILDQYRNVLLAQLEELQKQQNSMADKLIHFKTQCQDLGNQQFLQNFDQSYSPLLAKHAKGIETEIRYCHNQLLEAEQYRAALWQFITGEDKIDTAWKKIYHKVTAKKDNSNQEVNQFCREILNLRLYLYKKYSHYSDGLHHRSQCAKEKVQVQSITFDLKNRCSSFIKIYLEVLISNLKQHYDNTSDFIAREKSDQKNFLSTIGYLIDFTESLLSSSKPTSTP